MIEKTSPPVPVEVAPEASTSSASQVIAPTQVTGRWGVCSVRQPVQETCVWTLSQLYQVYKIARGRVSHNSTYLDNLNNVKKEEKA